MTQYITRRLQINHGKKYKEVIKIIYLCCSKEWEQPLPFRANRKQYSTVWYRHSTFEDNNGIVYRIVIVIVPFPTHRLIINQVSLAFPGLQDSRGSCSCP